MAECTCFELPTEMWHTHYGAVEPGSTHEPNPECPEHFPKNKHYCKDCLGAGRVRPTDRSVWFMDCPTCDGTGTIHRTGPYRLADGTWSDGVDRTHTIPSHEFSKANPERVYVHGTWDRDYFGRWKSVFDVWHGDTCIKTGWPFAEAVRYADRAARSGGSSNGMQS